MSISRTTFVLTAVVLAGGLALILARAVTASTPFVDGSGNVFVADSGNNRIQKDLNTQLLAVAFHPQVRQPVAFGGDDANPVRGVKVLCPRAVDAGFVPSARVHGSRQRVAIRDQVRQAGGPSERLGDEPPLSEIMRRVRIAPLETEACSQP